jgi:hypothetical protein
MAIDKINFIDLENQSSKTGESPLDYLATDLGKVYTVTITRDGCPACEKQKAKLIDLVNFMEKKFDGEVVFIQIHVSRPFNSEEESLRSKKLLGHYFYPTNLVLLRSRDRGAFEYYRCVSPDIQDLEKIVCRAL